MSRHNKNKSAAQAPKVSPDTDIDSLGGSTPGAGRSNATPVVADASAPTGTALPAAGTSVSGSSLRQALDAFEPEGSTLEGTLSAIRSPKTHIGDPVETPSLFRFEKPPAAEEKPKDSLDALDVAGLIALRSNIDARLPPLSISQMNLEEELLLQYHAAKALVAKAAGDDTIPTNQKAQVQNSCAAILKTLADAQVAVYSSERVKAIEQALEKAFQGYDDSIKKAFFERYARLVRDFSALKDARNQQFLRVSPQI